MLLSGPDNPQKLPLPVGGLNPHLIHCSLDARVSPWSLNVLLISSTAYAQHVCVTNTMTDNVAMGSIYAMYAIQPNNNKIFKALKVVQL